MGVWNKKKTFVCLIEVLIKFAPNERRFLIVVDLDKNLDLEPTQISRPKYVCFQGNDFEQGNYGILGWETNSKNTLTKMN